MTRKKNMKPNEYLNIFCDFDGTITYYDTTDSLLKTFADPAWERIEEEWERGEIGSLKCLEKQIQLLDMSKEELDAHLDQIEIDPDFEEFVQVVQEQGHQVTIVSDGLSYSIHRILGRYGITDLHIFANRLHRKSQRSWSISFPNADENCTYASGHCKCKTMKNELFLKQGQRPAMLIGDGRSDFCAAGAANFVFAKSKLIQHCIENGIAHFPIKNFKEALQLLNQILTPTKH